MLFKFNLFWQLLLSLVISWILYAIFDFEFAVITLLAAMLVFMARRE
jgi:hypothetical protein|tara:strand:+ start:486 stop:626 length:141 start_codon:yes stop_codon:yes gene_type:complete